MRHTLLRNYADYSKYLNQDLSHGVYLKELLTLYPDKDLQRAKAANYLFAAGYFKYLKNVNNNEECVVITPAGLDAVNGEYFLHEERKERREIINNRYTIAFGVITAFGVLFAILKDTLWSEGTSKQQVKIIIEQSTKTLPLASDSIKATLSPIVADSSNKKK